MFDFGIGSTELMLIAVVALIVIGPRDLPKVLRTVGQVMTKVRAMAREFQGHIEDAAKDSGLDDLKKDISKATNFDMNETLSDVAREPGKVSSPPEKEAPKTTSEPAAKPAKKAAAAKKPASGKAAAKKTATAKKTAAAKGTTA
ncbi:Sec-independent protein translocase protein TatB [Anderseniella sp. Alg231-50]|uniref:Sec-independent protein translocase protein TatB n=1 Tax=Anderseniella sp. Alg231-50 TaxID=1922226 RepID=UPI000D559037